MSRVEADLCLNTCGEIIKLNKNYTRRTVFNIQARCSPWMNIRQSSSKPRKGIRLFTLMDWPILDAICDKDKTYIQYTSGSDILYQVSGLEHSHFHGVEGL